MSLRKQAVSGMVWSFSQQFSTQLISFIVSVILARVLIPAEFGLIGMIGIFIGIGQVLLNGGLTQSLIRSQNPDQDDYSTVFFFNLGGSIVVYTILFFVAPYIAEFYQQAILTNIIRIFSLTFIISAFSAVQQTRLTKELNFKTQMVIAVPALIVSSTVGITMAYNGFGVWSLVWSTILNTLLSTVQLWYYSKWTPSFVFSREKFLVHFNFGYKLTLSGLLDTVFVNIYPILIGRYFSPAQVGFYTRADTLTQLPVGNIAGVLSKVTYPLFSTIQDDDVRLKRVYKQIMQMVIFLIAPTLTFMSILAEPIFRLLFTEKWLPAVPYFQILCFTGILYPIHSYNLNILNVKGRSDLFLKLEVIKKTLITIGVIIALQFGIYGLLWSQVILSILILFVNTHYSGKIINYHTWEQIKDIIPILALSATMGAIVFLFDLYLKTTVQIDVIRILLSLAISVIIYTGLAYILKFNSLNDLKNLLLKK